MLEVAGRKQAALEGVCAFNTVLIDCHHEDLSEIIQLCQEPQCCGGKRLLILLKKNRCDLFPIMAANGHEFVTVCFGRTLPRLQPGWAASVVRKIISPLGT